MRGAHLHCRCTQVHAGDSPGAGAVHAGQLDNIFWLECRQGAQAGAPSRPHRPRQAAHSGLEVPLSQQQQ